jgi:hypothetical protein
MRADSANSTEVARVFGAIDQKFGKIDVLVNNAAIIARHSRLQNLEFERMRRIFAANGKGAEPFACERLTVALKKEKGPWLMPKGLVWRAGGVSATSTVLSIWRARLGSNQQPLPSEGSTLSIELRAHHHKLRRIFAKARQPERPRRHRERPQGYPVSAEPSTGRPPTPIPATSTQRPTVLTDAGKRLLNTVRAPSPPPKPCVYNRPWLIKNKKLPSRCTAHIPTETRQA